MIDGDTVPVTLDVSEIWVPGEDPGGVHELNAEGCFAVALRWHIQVGQASARTLDCFVATSRGSSARTEVG